MADLLDGDGASTLAVRGGTEHPDRTQYEQVDGDGRAIHGSSVIVFQDGAGRVTRVTSSLAHADAVHAADRRASPDPVAATTRLAELLPDTEALHTEPFTWLESSRGVVRRGWRSYRQTAGQPTEAWMDEDGSLAWAGDLFERVEQEEIYFMNSTWPPGPPPGHYTDYQLVYSNPPSTWIGSWPGTTYFGALGTAWTSWYWTNFYGRDGWDDNPSTSWPLATITDLPPGNAFWYPPSLAAAILGLEGTISIGSSHACTDVLAHEWGHAMMFDELGLPISGPISEHDALDEAFSDMHGEYVEDAQYGTHDWYVGSGGSCSPIRRMSAPEANCGTGCNPGPQHYSNYGGINPTDIEYGGAMIADYAAFLAGREPSEGPITTAGLTVTGLGIDVLSDFTYSIVRNRLARTDGFADLASHWKNEAAARWPTSSADYQNMVRAIDAVGLWTGSALTSGPHTLDRMAFADTVISGQSRTYVFYRSDATSGAGQNRLHYRYRTCPVFANSTCVWSAEQVASWTLGAPAAAQYGSDVWLFHRYDLDTSLRARRLSAGGTWTSETLPGAPQSETGVAAANFAGSLHVFYRPPGVSTIHYLRRTGSTWTGPINLSSSTADSAPTATVVGDRLYLVYRRGSGTGNLFYRSMSSSFVWNGESVILNQAGYQVGPAEGDPTTTSFRGRLHVAARDSNGDIRYSSFCPTGTGCTYRPGEWTMTVRLRTQTAAPVTLHQDAGVYPYGQTLYVLSSNLGAVWWDYKLSE